jgi:DNA replication and repair protein RecF
MILRKLSLLNFKNYSELSLEFSESVNCLAGNNGSGKTNILDAIHYLALCKSYFNASDSQHIKRNEQMFVIQGDFLIGGMEESVFCGFRLSQKKMFKRNQKEYERLSEHIGLLPVVMIAPVDQEIISGGSEERRKFIDSIISQTDKEYLRELIQYNKILTQRNALLKQMAAQRITDHLALEIWDDQLAPLGEKIHEKRNAFCVRFTPVLENLYKRLSGQKEKISMTYESDLTGKKFSDILKSSFSRDAAVQYTTSGIHKDDLLFDINGMNAKKFASQGQQKTFVVALKLAQYEIMRSVKNTKPILMLDDIFDKLDEVRVARLMELVAEERFGQLFITDTHPERVAEIFNRISMPVKKFLLEDGNILEEDYV